MNDTLLKEYLALNAMWKYYGSTDDVDKEDFYFEQVDDLWRATPEAEWKEMEEALVAVYKDHHDTYVIWRKCGHVE